MAAADTLRDVPEFFEYVLVCFAAIGLGGMALTVFVLVPTYLLSLFELGPARTAAWEMIDHQDGIGRISTCSDRDPL